MALLTPLALLLLAPNVQDEAVSRPPIGPVLSSTIKRGKERDATPLNNPGEWVTSTDYPAAALRERAEGATRVKLTIGIDGKVTACEVVASSEFDALDSATCSLISERATFQSALNSAGAPVKGSYSTTVRWKFPDGASSKPQLPQNSIMSFIVEPDGSYTECKVTFEQSDDQSRPNEIYSCPPDGLSAFADKDGTAIRKRVIITTTVATEDVK